MNILKALDEADKEFIEQNIKKDSSALALKYHGDERRSFLVSQIKARQQIRKKLPQWYSNSDLIFPAGLPLEQASSEATAKLKSSLISGNEVLDITGGLGVDSCYLSQSFNKTTYVEQNEELATHARHNFGVLKASIEVLHADGPEKLAHSTADVVYVDPYRRDEDQRKLISLTDYQPNVKELLDLLTRNGRRSMIKTSPMLDISQGISQLQQVSEVWVISHRNECKELVFLLEAGTTKQPEIKTYNLGTTDIQEFRWPGADIPDIATSKVLQYLYEPNSSVMKAGIQDAVAAELKLCKLHPNSNFYTSDKRVQPFPGKSFEVKDVVKAWDKSLKGGRYNVISRNFPAKANQIEKKLKLTPSDHNYLIATRLFNNSLRFVMAHQLSN